MKEKYIMLMLFFLKMVREYSEIHFMEDTIINIIKDEI